jgi:hypothetical protein
MQPAGRLVTCGKLFIDVMDAPERLFECFGASQTHDRDHWAMPKWPHAASGCLWRTRPPSLRLAKPLKPRPIPGRRHPGAPFERPPAESGIVIPHLVRHNVRRLIHGLQQLLRLLYAQGLQMPLLPVLRPRNKAPCGRSFYSDYKYSPWPAETFLLTVRVGGRNLQKRPGIKLKEAPC